ncbi:MAG: hypothetical protein FJ271_18875 [Planctomycetes bacterium]|nr:hypothetical protein [Planctomycetota bacterium]
MPDITQPVILFPAPMITGNHMHEDAMLGTKLDFAIPAALTSGTTINVQFWPAGAATTIASASFSINGGAPSPIALTAIPGGGGGKSATITLTGNVRDRNRLEVTCADNAAQSKTATVYYYLKAAALAAVKKSARSSKTTKGKKK